MNEKWRDIPELKGCYQASDLGRIRSMDRISKLNNQGGDCLRPIKGKIIKQTIHPKTGYMMLAVCVDGFVMTRLAHRLIASAFHDNPENKPQVNHINGIKTDNRPLNLEWSTISHNRQHSYDIGLATAAGEKNSQVKLTKNEVLAIRNATDRNGVIAKRFGISPATVCDIQKRRSWTHL